MLRYLRLINTLLKFVIRDYEKSNLFTLFLSKTHIQLTAHDLLWRIRKHLLYEGVYLLYTFFT